MRRTPAWRKPLIDALGEDIDEVFLLDAKKIINSRPARWLQVALKEPQAASTFDLHVADAALAQSSVPNRALEQQAPDNQPVTSVVNSRAALWGVALLLGLGAWQQSRRWRRAVNT